MIAIVDSNGDGQLDFAEFTQLLSMQEDKSPVQTGQQDDAMLKAFKIFGTTVLWFFHRCCLDSHDFTADKNGDGHISAFELGQTLANLGENLSEDELAEMMKKVDVNRDGFLDYSEFVLMMKSQAAPQ